MKSLYSLDIRHRPGHGMRTHPPDVGKDLFSDPDCFPNLKRLEMYELGFPSKWNVTRLWNGLEYIKLWFETSEDDHQIDMKIFLSVMKDELKNVRVLKLWFSQVLELPAGTIFHLPRVEKLKISDLKNLRIEAGKQLKKVTIGRVDSEMLIDLLHKHWSNLETLKIKHLQDFDFHSVLRYTKNNLKVLEVNNVNNEFIENESIPSTENERKFQEGIYSFGKSLEKLTLWNVPIREENLTYEYKNLSEKLGKWEESVLKSDLPVFKTVRLFSKLYSLFFNTYDTFLN